MGSSSKNPSFPSQSDPLNTLKFGQKIYFEDMGIAPQTKSGDGSDKSPAKKVRSEGPKCQVEGCGVDLSEAKAYYGRHKVCGVHSKTPCVIVNGIEQRFCQQCSRFHQLAEFDQGKRSCRRRLAGHNERRRKPPPGPLFSSPYGRLPSSVFEAGKGGGFLMDFSKYPKLPERDSNPLPRSVPLLWHDNSSNHQPNSFPQGSSSGTHYPTGPTIPSGECALSLLSNNTWGPQYGPSGPFVCVEEAQVVQSTVAVGQFSNVSWGFKGQEDCIGSNEMPHHHMGFNRFTQPADNQYSSSLDHSRAFDSSTQYMKWSL